MKKKVENITTTELKRYLGALHEEHLDALEGIKEGFSIINNKLDRHEEILNEHTGILASHTETLESHTEMIGKLMIDVEVIKEDISLIKGDLKKKVDIDEFRSLERRVLLLEKRRA